MTDTANDYAELSREAIEDMRSKWRENPAMPAHQRLTFDYICDRALVALSASPSPPALDGAGRDGITDEMVRAGAFAAWASTTPFAGLTEAAFRAKIDQHVRTVDLGQGATLEQDMLLDWELNADTFCILARATLKAAIRSLKETP